MSELRISDDELSQLIHYFLTEYRSNGKCDQLDDIQSKCEKLFEADYDIGAVSNEHGQLCSHYPLRLIIPEKHKGKSDPSVNNAADLEDSFAEGKCARTRQRFPAPVILWGKTNICRSATLSRTAEATVRQGTGRVNNLLFGAPPVTTTSSIKDLESSVYSAASASLRQKASDDESYISYYRQKDVQLLHQLGVHYICDLMIETRKIKYGFAVTSSEKADAHNRYSDFSLVVIPYPGVEWFRSVRADSFDPETILMDWKNAEVNAELSVPESSCGVNWAQHKNWNLIEQTRNYIKLLLALLRDNEDVEGEGLLVHCVSGWDRTPLFISLLRILLWAEGEIHQNLGAKELLYLTIGYDWLLFGHQMQDRLARKEEIMFFCFDFLQYLVDDEYSLRGPQAPHPPDNMSMSLLNDALSDCEKSRVSESPQSDPASNPDRTAPMAMPTSERRESQEEFNVGSWQLVDEVCPSDSSRAAERSGQCSIDGSKSKGAEPPMRAKRLLKLRELFVPSYGETMSRKVAEQPHLFTWITGIVMGVTKAQEYRA